MDNNLPPPPPGVTGRATPPPYTPPWGTAPPPTTPWPPKVPEPPKPANGKRFAAIILAALGLLGLGVAIGRGGDDPAVESADVTSTTVAPVTAVRPTTTVYRSAATTAPAFTDREIQELALDIMWRDAPYSTQQDICDGVELFGVDVAAGIMIDGADGDFDRDIVERKLVEWCGSY